MTGCKGYGLRGSDARTKRAPAKSEILWEEEEQRSERAFGLARKRAIWSLRRRERIKEADTPGEIPGRSGLQADRRTGNKFIMRGAWLRSKEMEEIIVTLSMKEKKILYAYGCPSHHNTVTRLKWLTALTVDPEAKRRMLGLARKVETEVDESWYEAFYHHLRMEMDEYRRLKRSLRMLKSYTDYEEDLYEEAV